MKRLAIGLICCAFVCSAATPAHAIKLFGITGNQGSAAPPGSFDESIYDINLTTGAGTFVKTMTAARDGEALEYHPLNGALYRLSGHEQYSDNETSPAYQDVHFAEDYNLKTGALTALYHSRGVLAPQPAWVLPQGDRQSGAPRERGVNEYHELRGMSWSPSLGKLFGSDELGFFEFTLGGATQLEPKFLGQPATLGDKSKGLAFATIGGQAKLFATHRDEMRIWEIDPATGAEIGAEKALTFSGAFMLKSIVAMATNPLDGQIYGVAKLVGTDVDRELVKIDPVTGTVTDVGAIGLHVADLAFVPDKLLTGDMNGDGAVNNLDIAPFAQALTDAATFVAANPNVWILNGDINADGVLNNLDISPFAALLVGPGASPVPEPSTLFLASLAAIGLCVRATTRFRGRTAA